MLGVHTRVGEGPGAKLVAASPRCAIAQTASGPALRRAQGGTTGRSCEVPLCSVRRDDLQGVGGGPAGRVVGLLVPDERERDLVRAVRHLAGDEPAARGGPRA